MDARYSKSLKKDLFSIVCFQQMGARSNKKKVDEII